MPLADSNEEDLGVWATKIGSLSGPSVSVCEPRSCQDLLKVQRFNCERISKADSTCHWRRGFDFWVLHLPSEF